MHPKLLLSVSLALLVSAGAVCSLRIGSQLLSNSAAPAVEGEPRLSCPQAIDCGDVDQGAIAVARVDLSNPGTGTLYIHGFAPSCVCAGLELKENGEFRKIESLRLEPGEQCTTYFRFTVRGRSGETICHHLQFKSNDPSKLEHRLSVAVRSRGGFLSLPRMVAFGNVLVGATAEQRVQLLDEYPSPRVVAKIVSRRPELYSAELEEGRQDLALPSKGQRSLGVALVRLNTHVPARVDDRILVYFTDPAHPPEELQLSAQVVPLAEFIPKAVVVNASRLAPGQPPCDVELLSHHPDLKRLDVIETPPGLTIVVNSQNKVERPFRVAVAGNVSLPGTPAKFVARLRAVSAEASVDLELPIYVRAATVP